MAVPYQPFPSVPSEGVPARSHDYEEIHADPGAFGAQVGQATKQLGGQIEQSGQELFKVGMQKAAIDNHLWANDQNADFVNKATDLYSEYQKNQGQDAVSALGKFKTDMQNLYQAQVSSAPNPMAKQLISDNARYYADWYMRSGTNYADKERKTWLDRSLTDSAQTFSDKAVLAVRSPPDFQKQLEFGQQSWRAWAQVRGLDGDAEVAKFTGVTVNGAIDTLIKEGDSDSIGRAHAMLDAYKSQMDVRGQRQAIDKLAPILTAETAKTSNDKVLSNLSQGQPQQSGATMSLAEAVEKGGEHGHVGDIGPVTASGERALGPMQVMPSTAKDVAKQIGEPYDENQVRFNEDYNRRLGTTYLNNMMSKYSGDKTLAVAAYNAGPGNVDGWIQRFGDPRTGAISDADFAAKIPFQETRDYLSRVNEKHPLAGPATGAPLIPAVAGQASGPAGIDPSRRAQEYQAVYEDGTRLGQSAPVMKARFADLKQRHEAEDAAYVDFEHAQKVQTQQNEQQVNQREMQYKQGMVDKPGSVTLQQIIKDPVLTGSVQGREAIDRLNSWIKAGVEENDKDAKEYGSKFNDLFRRVHAADGDPNKIESVNEIYSHLGNGLTKAGTSALETALKSQDTEASKQFFKQMDTTITKRNPLTGVADPKGEALYNTFLKAALPEIEKLKQQQVPLGKIYAADGPIATLATDLHLIRPFAEQMKDLEDANGLGEPPPPGVNLTTQQGIKDAYDNHKITRDRARQALDDIGVKYDKTPRFRPMVPPGGGAPQPAYEQP